MPNSQSKAAVNDDAKSKWVYIHMWANITGICVLLQARPMLMSRNLRGNASEVARIMSYMSAGVGALELLLNPMAGQLSDKYGRRNFLLLSPIINFFNKLYVAFNPSLAALAWERVIDGAITTLGGSTTCAASLSDLFSGQKLGKAFGNLGSAAGIGALCGSFISGRLLTRNWSPENLFVLSAFFGLIQFITNYFCVAETLAIENRSQKSIDIPNPFSCISLLTGPSNLRKMVIVAVMQCMPEGKNISDMLQIYSSENVGMVPVERANFVTAFGMCMMFGGPLVKRTIGMFGNRGHTTFSNAMTIASFIMYGIGQNYYNMWLGLLLLLPTMERRAATSAMATDLAVAGGMGRGEYSAKFGNIRALTVIIAPLFYGNIYAYFAPRGKPGYAWYAGALVVLLAEALHRTLKDEECFPKGEKVDAEKCWGIFGKKVNKQ